MLSLPVEARAQHASLSGFVVDREGGQPLDLVNVVLRNESGTIVRGVSTNRDGHYHIPRITPGVYRLTASLIGYATFSETISLTIDQSRIQNITLEIDESELDEVIVQSERTTGAARVTAGHQIIRPADLELVPSPDVSGDLVSYLTTLPGVVTTGDRGGQLFIRGGEPSQNLVQLDGMVIYQPFHLLGFYSAIPAEIVQRADFYAGGFGANFGERISSVIDVWSRNGNTRRLNGSVAVSPFINSVSLEGPLVKDRVSVLASGRYSVLEHGAERIINQSLPFKFGDFFGKLHAEISENGRLSVSALQTYDRGSLGGTPGTALGEEISWQNQALGFRYLLLPRNYPALVDVRVSYSNLNSELGDDDVPVRSSNIQHYQAGFDAVFFGESSDLEIGFLTRGIVLNTELGGLYQNFEFRTATIDPFAAYLEPVFKLQRFQIRPSLRLQTLSSNMMPIIEPRLRVIMSHGVHHFSVAMGLYHQELLGLTDRRDAAGVFIAWANLPRRDPRLDEIRMGRVPKALHAILGYRSTPLSWLDVSLEGFYKDLRNLFISEWTPFPEFNTRLQPAAGNSYGFDTRAEWRYRGLYGFVNYGLSFTNYEAQQSTLKHWYGEEAIRFRPPHDRRHQVNALIRATAGGFNLSTRWQFGSGMPFNRVLGFDGTVLMDDLVDVSKVRAHRRVLYDDPFKGELPTYHRLDVSLDRAFTFENMRLTIQASVFNLYDRRNIFYFDVFTLQRVDQLPFIPSLGIKFDFE